MAGGLPDEPDFGLTVYDNLGPGFSPKGKNTLNIIATQGFDYWKKLRDRLLLRQQGCLRQGEDAPGRRPHRQGREDAPARPAQGHRGRRGGHAPDERPLHLESPRGRSTAGTRPSTTRDRGASRRERPSRTSISRAPGPSPGAATAPASPAAWPVSPK
ncbi:MAG: hypothetical protein M0C28_12990 [Candidatus Moduliflexus flocculans]|nr:hypothetical protein [Candidatus Moduliflexus flocculans]